MKVADINIPIENKPLREAVHNSFYVDAKQNEWLERKDGFFSGSKPYTTGTVKDSAVNSNT